MNKQTNLSEHMTLAELCKTKTGIENVPNEANVVWIHFAVRPSGNRRRTNFKR